MYKAHHLVTLQAVVRTGSFALAARELGYTPSAVSQQIAMLEKDTGLVLFEREARGVRITAAADRLVELSRPVLAGLDELETQIGRLASGAIGRIRLGSFPTASVRVVPGLLSEFARHRPGAEVTLEEGEPAELVDGLAAGDLDVALLYEYGLCPREWPDGLTTLPLLREDLVLVQRSGSRSGDLARLSGQRWIASREGTSGALSLTRLCAAAGFRPEIMVRTNNYDVVRELVVATGGVAVVPALGHHSDERIAAARLPQRGAHRTVHAACRTGSSNPLLGDFLAAAGRALPADSPYLTILG